MASHSATLFGFIRSTNAMSFVLGNTPSFLDARQSKVTHARKFASLSRRIFGSFIASS